MADECLNSGQSRQLEIFLLTADSIPGVMSKTRHQLHGLDKPNRKGGASAQPRMQRKTIDALPSRSKEKAFGGRWRIEELELWDQEVADEFGPAHITFEKNGLGHFHFCCVDAELDWRFDRQRNRTEFTFEGQDEMDEVSGRGWARIEGPDNQMVGEIAFHRGDESGFKAKRSQS